MYISYSLIHKKKNSNKTEMVIIGGGHSGASHSG
jgi:hypothetical protein